MPLHMKEKKIEIRETERSILFYLLNEHIEKGDYFGRKDQHYKMCRELLKKLV